MVDANHTALEDARLGAASPAYNAGPIGVQAVAPEAEFSLYPNPSRGVIEVKYKEQGTLSVYDTTGREVANYRLQTSVANANRLSIKLDGLSIGVYQYRYIADNGAGKTGKLIIED